MNQTTPLHALLLTHTDIALLQDAGLVGVVQAYPAPHPAAVCFRVLNGETCVGEELRLPLTSLKGVDSIFGCSLAAGAPGLRTLAAASGAAVGSHWARKYVVRGSSITADWRHAM